MLDIELLRNRPDDVKESLAHVNSDATQVDTILDLDERRRAILSQVEQLRAERNRVSRSIGRMRDADERERLIAEMRIVGDSIDALDEDLAEIQSSLDRAMLALPNLPHASVPVGPDESGNVVLETWGSVPGFDFEPVPHWDLGPELRIIDFERGAKLSGSRFYVLFSAGARLQRALTSWMLHVHTEDHGYTEVYPPYLVREQCFWGSGQMPWLIDNIYRDVEDDLWLIGTAEIPLANLHRDEILGAEDLPLNYVAYTACFRREKMSAGRDVRGIKRGHQFDKVEMYKLTTPDTSYDELEAMVGHARRICRDLGLRHRIVQVCTGDQSVHVTKTYDIELWAPGCGEWLEVSSLSNCEAFQARRTNTRYRPERGAKPEYVHTLNGSGLALPRLMIAVIENYQQVDGTVLVPDVLRPWMGGIEVIDGTR